MEAVTDRLLSRFCPVKHKDGADFGDILIEKYRETGADGIVIFLLRYCDPQYMEYAATRYKLEDADIPFIVLEPEMTGTVSGQVETRLEAFFERIQEQI